MCEKAIMIIVDGAPRGKARPRFRRVGQYVQTYTDEATRRYEDAIRAAIPQGAASFSEDVPLRLSIISYHPIPKSWSKTKRAAAETHDIRPIGKPDSDNILKIVADALQGEGGIIPDDRQIVEMSIRKEYDKVPRIEITVQEVTR